MALTREQYVTESVDAFLRANLTAASYTADNVEVAAEFPHTRFKDNPLDKTYVTAGFDFDDTGKPAEMGSNLKLRLYTIEFFVFGKTQTWGKNVAGAVKFSLERDGVIPLLDIADPARPQIDALVVAGVSSQEEEANNPLPWQENVWTVRLRVEDTYLPADALT
jgi:hypothetical protein